MDTVTAFKGTYIFKTYILFFVFLMLYCWSDAATCQIGLFLFIYFLSSLCTAAATLLLIGKSFKQVESPFCSPSRAKLGRNGAN